MIVKTLVGVGGGTIGMSEKGQAFGYTPMPPRIRLRAETGKNLSLYPAEWLTGSCPRIWIAIALTSASS